MKRLLLAPLLIASLLIPDSVLAGRPNPNLGKAKRQQQEYISQCNEQKSWSSCEKIWKSNLNQVTNKRFFESKKREAFTEVNNCLVKKRMFTCYLLSSIGINDEREEQLWWIKDELTEKQKQKIEQLGQKWWDSIDTDSPKKPVVKKIELLRSCEYVIKAFLKDPYSYKRINSRYMQEATGIIEYTATNSFGGRVRESYKCFDP